MSLEEKEEVIENPDPHFEPIISLPPVQVKTLEEDELELVKLRAKLFRYDTDSEPREWKERGTGDVKILKHKTDGACRILMRRDKTFKICANHYITPDLELKPNCCSDRAWVWSTLADFADEEPKPELLAIRFASSENAQKFKTTFDEAKSLAIARSEANKSARSMNNTSTTSNKQDNEGEVDENESSKKAQNEVQTNGEINKDTKEKDATQIEVVAKETGEDACQENGDVTKQLEQLTVAEK